MTVLTVLVVMSQLVLHVDVAAVVTDSLMHADGANNAITGSRMAMIMMTVIAYADECYEDDGTAVAADLHIFENQTQNIGTNYGHIRVDARFSNSRDKHDNEY